MARDQSRDELNELLSSNLALFSWRLFDIFESRGDTMAILRTPLSEHRAVLAELNGIPGISTLTSSGKIRLVRKRLGS